jgi:hypothetical protein
LVAIDPSRRRGSTRVPVTDLIRASEAGAPDVIAALLVAVAGPRPGFAGRAEACFWLVSWTIDAVADRVRVAAHLEHVVTFRGARRAGAMPVVVYNGDDGAGELIAAGRARWNVAPCSAFAVAHRRPPWRSTIERLIDRPIPRPPGLVV